MLTTRGMDEGSGASVPLCTVHTMLNIQPQPRARGGVNRGSDREGGRKAAVAGLRAR